MTQPEFISTFEEALEVDPGTITGAESLREAGWWDSMASLVFMSLADEKLGVMVTGGDLEKCVVFPDLIALLGDKIES